MVVLYLVSQFTLKLLEYSTETILTDAVLFIHSSLVNPQGLLSITILLAHDQTFQLLDTYYYKPPWVLTKNIIFSYGVSFQSKASQYN